MKAARSGAVEGNGQRTDRRRKKTATGEQEGKQDQTLRSDDLRALVAAQAYSFYEQRGYEDGYDLEDWLEAERRILTE
jgi:hypothetical protein